MGARAIWKGVIRFEGLAVPVKFYSAVEDQGVHFRLLHAEDGVPVKQRMVDPATGDEVPYEEARRGLEVEDGVYVVFTDEELEELEPDDSRDIEVTRFVPSDAVDARWYDRPYYLHPDGEPRAYASLAKALEGSGREGIARWVMRKKRYRGALRVRDGYLAMMTLRSAERVIDASALEAPEGREAEPRELELAEQLVGALEAAFEPERFENTYREQVLELIAAKSRGETFELSRPSETEREEGSLAETLEQSVADAGRAA